MPRAPLLLRLQVECLDPAACPKRVHSSICVARVKDDLVVVLHEHLVDPFGTLKLHLVVVSDRVAAHLPGLHAVGDVEGLADVGPVDVVGEEVAEEGLLSLELGFVLQESNVLLEGETSLVCLILAADVYCSVSGLTCVCRKLTWVDMSK